MKAGKENKDDRKNTKKKRGKLKTRKNKKKYSKNNFLKLGNFFEGKEV